jgi:hypothetical protein
MRSFSSAENMIVGLRYPVRRPEIGVVSAAVGVYLFDWPCLNGLVYVPGTGQVASVSFT